MAHVSNRSPGPRPAEAPGVVAIVDTIEMKSSLGIAHAPGVVAVLDSFAPPDPTAFVGLQVRIRTADGRERCARVEAVRDHGTTISFFFRGLNRADVPIGARLAFE